MRRIATLPAVLLGTFMGVSMKMPSGLEPLLYAGFGSFSPEFQGRCGFTICQNSGIGQLVHRMVVQASAGRKFLPLQSSRKRNKSN